jgi:hypothetical protein
MRRRALKDANLMKARTVSVQSNVSFFRRDNETQVYPSREESSQTGVSRGTNPPRVVRYISGASSPGFSTIGVIQRWRRVGCMLC